MKMPRNNKTSFLVKENSEKHNYIKHIDLIYYYIWELIDDKKL